MDALVAMVRRIAENDYDGEYYPLPESGDLVPAGYDEKSLISKHAFIYDRAHGEEAIEKD